MSATKPADLTLAIQKATEGFTAIVDRPTDTDIIDICKLLLPVFLETKYDEIEMKHNLSGVILPTDRYDEIYGEGPHIIPHVVALYDETIKADATRTEVNQAEGKHNARRNDRALYDTANTKCKKFIMEVVDETWYKELEDHDTFYTKVTALKLLDRLTEFCSGFHAVDAVDIPQLMKTLYVDVEGIPQFINAMEATQRKPKRAKLEVKDDYMHAVALKSLLKSGEYETETREWSKLPVHEQTWAARKTKFREAYVAKRRAEAAREGE